MTYENTYSCLLDKFALCVGCKLFVIFKSVYFNDYLNVDLTKDKR